MASGEGQACRHCGLPVVAGRAFCCSGCAVAHALVLRDPDGRTDRWLARVVVAAFLSMGVMVFSLSLYGAYLDPGVEAERGAAEALTGIFRLGAMALTLPILLLIAVPLFDAVRTERRWLSADALVVVSTASAFAVSALRTFRGLEGGVYFETAALVLTLFGLGRWLETRSRERAADALRDLVPDRERPVLVVREEGDLEVPPAEVRAGQSVRVLAGDVVPVDGRVVSGRAFVDTAALTGEEQPRAVQPGAVVHAGTRLVDGALVVRTEGVVGERRRDDVERVLREALGQRSSQVRLADRLAAWLMPLALATAAAAVALAWGSLGAEEALMRGLAVVLIACPCALGIATPLAFWVGVEGVWRRGMLVRGGEVLERLARVDTVLFDKTGTLTSGELRLRALEPLDGTPASELLHVAASVERASRHPLARALVRAAAERSDLPALAEPEDVRVLPGRGIEGRVGARVWSLLRPSEPPPEPGRAHGRGDSLVELARDGEPVARLWFAARSRPETPAVLSALRDSGLATGVLTGDRRAAADALAQALDIPVEAELDPVDKVERVRAAALEARARGRAVAYVGDGLNDAPSLAAADVGISMSSGAEVTLAAADVNLLRDGLKELPELFGAARAAVMTARVNLAWAVGYNLIGVALAATGRLTPVFAAAAMVLSSAAVVLNTRRLTRGVAPREAQPPAHPARAAGPDAGDAEPRASLSAPRTHPHTA